jgi:anti-sigma B factor antagonist
MNGWPPRPFDAGELGLGGAPGVAVRGEVDIAAAQALETALEAKIRDSVGAFVIDLTEVEFLDSSGLSVLLRARALLGREDRALALICPPGPVRRLLDIAGAADVFEMYGSRDEAADALVPPD